MLQDIEQFNIPLQIQTYICLYTAKYEMIKKMFSCEVRTKMEYPQNVIFISNYLLNIFINSHIEDLQWKIKIVFIGEIYLHPFYFLINLKI